jgi:dUTP pyrophosphatase
MKINIINKSKHSLPGYSKISAAGMYIQPSLEEEIVLNPLEQKLTNAEVYLEIRKGSETQILARKRLTANNGVTLGFGNTGRK